MCLGQDGGPSEIWLDVPEEVKSQLPCFLLSSHMLAVLCLPQLVCEGHCQVVLANVLLHLMFTTYASNLACKQQVMYCSDFMLLGSKPDSPCWCQSAHNSRMDVKKPASF